MFRFIYLFTFILLLVFVSSPKSIADIFDAKVICKVKGIKKGKLALRKNDDAITPYVYLSNGDVVQAYAGSVDSNYPLTKHGWNSVEVKQSSNHSLVGKQGVVNSKYSKCKWYDLKNGSLIREDS